MDDFIKNIASPVIDSAYWPYAVALIVAGMLISFLLVSAIFSVWLAYSVVWLAYGMRLISTALLQVGPELQFVYLKGNGDLIAERLRSRHDHFADVQILASQLADLEEPEDAIPVDIARPPEEIVKEIRKQLRVA